MGKISAKIDLMKLAGAQIVKSNKTGHNLLVFNLDDNSTRLTTFKRRDNTMGVDCKLDVIPNTRPNEYNEDTHWIAQQLTKEERLANVKFPSVGSGREWPDRDANPQGQNQRQSYQQPEQRQNAPRQGQQRQPMPEKEHSWGAEDDDIAF